MEYYKEKLSPEILQKRFPEFETALCQEITDNGTWAHIEKGEHIMKNDQYIQSFPLVLDGLLRIYREDDKGRETQLYYLNTGEVCSMALTCCVSRLKSNISAIAEEDADVMLVPVNFLDEWMSKYTSWKHFVMYSYKDRFDELIETIDSLAFKKMDERLIAFFEEYNSSTGNTEFKGTHEEIARALTSSREVVSRLLKTLEKQGKVALSRNKVEFSKLIK